MKKRKKKNKKEKKKLLLIASGVIFFVIALCLWSIWFGNHNPQTGFQFIASIINNNIPKDKPSADIIFLGDSITSMEDWNGLFNVDNIKNAGISGDTTDNVLDRLDPLVSLKPKKMFLMIGINDLTKGKDVSYVLANCETIIKKIRAELPDTALFIESVLPIDNGLSPIGKVDSQKIINLNSGLKLLAEQNGSTFLNLYPNFVNANSKMNVKYAGDGVHPNVHGYELMRELLVQYVK